MHRTVYKYAPIKHSMLKTNKQTNKPNGPTSPSRVYPLSHVTKVLSHPEPILGFPASPPALPGLPIFQPIWLPACPTPPGLLTQLLPGPRLKNQMRNSQYSITHQLTGGAGGTEELDRSPALECPAVPGVNPLVPTLWGSGQNPR